MEAEAAPRPKRRLPEWLSVPWGWRDLLLFLFLYLLAVQVLIGIVLLAGSAVLPAVAQFVNAAKKGEVVSSFTLDLADAAAGFGLVWLWLRKYKVGWSTVGWRRANLGRALVYLAVLLLGFIVLASLLLIILGALLQGFNANQPQSNQFTNGVSSHMSISIVALVLLPPILEETIFRGFIFPTIAKYTGMIWGAVLSSLLFAILHFQANIGVYTFILGLVLCFMYVKLKSIVPGMFLHMINNYLAFLALSHK